MQLLAGKRETYHSMKPTAGRCVAKIKDEL